MGFMAQIFGNLGTKQSAQSLPNEDNHERHVQLFGVPERTYIYRYSTHTVCIRFHTFFMWNFSCRTRLIIIFAEGCHLMLMCGPSKEQKDGNVGDFLNSFLPSDFFLLVCWWRIEKAKSGHEPASTRRKKRSVSHTMWSNLDV